MERIRQLLDPFGYGLPRRAVLAPGTMVFIDKRKASTEPEIEVVSQICAVLQEQEPRRADELLYRALTLDRDSAWEAVRDDLVLGYPLVVDDDPVAAVRAMLVRPTECKVFVCCKLLQKCSPVEAVGDALEDLCASVVGLRSDVACTAFRELLECNPQDPTRVLTILRDDPSTCVLFPPDAVPVEAADLVASYARGVPAKTRRHALGLLAGLVHRGATASGIADLGVSTLIDMHKSRMDVRVVAAAAVLIQTSEDRTLRGLATVTESLAAALQARSLDRTPVPTRDSPGPSN